jgi:hypothetical protein
MGRRRDIHAYVAVLGWAGLGLASLGEGEREPVGQARQAVCC